MVDRVDIHRLLTDMKTFKAQSQAFNPIKSLESGAGSVEGIAPNKPVAFENIFQQALNKVNEVQQASSQTANAYLKGDASVDITDVMIASQKSSVSFQAAVQVRNKLVEAYKDIMNMPI